MKRLILTVAAIFMSISAASAQNRLLACQADEAAGLEWEGNEWVAKAFEPDPAKFILVLTGNSLTPSSVAEYFDDGNRMPNCTVQDFTGQIFCASGYSSGVSLVYTPSTMKGARADLYGGSMEGPLDPVFVTTFTCQPF